MPFDTAYAVAKARTAAHKRGWRVEWNRLHAAMTPAKQAA